MRRRPEDAAPKGALPLALLALGSVAVFLAASFSPSSPGSRSSGVSDVGCAASTDAPAAVLAREAAPVFPGLDVAGVPIRSLGPERVPADPPRRDDGPLSVLIETRMAEKYRPFRESLTLP